MTRTNTIPIDVTTERSGPAQHSVWDAAREHIPFALVVWLVHLIATQTAAFLSFRFGAVRTIRFADSSWTGFTEDWGPDSSAYGIVRDTLPGWQHWLVEPFRNWDGTWYSLIAEQGYQANMPATAAFFPLYPTLMRWGHSLTGLPVETVGWAISRLAFLWALILISALVTADFNLRIARWAMVAIAVFPTSFFFGAVYTESLFLLLAVTTLWAAQKNDWVLAVILCLLAVMTRSAGIMLGLPLAVLFVQQHGWNISRWFPKVLLGIVPPFGLVIFGMQLRSAGLGFFDWQNQQWQWNRFSAMPWRTLQCVTQGCVADVRQFGNTSKAFPVHPVSLRWFTEAWDHRFSPAYLTSTEFRYLVGQSQVLDVLVTIVAIALIIVGFIKLPLYYSAWTVVPFAVPLFAPSSVFPLMSMPRFVLPMVPLSVMVVLLVHTRPRLARILAIISTALLLLSVSQFALWYWVA